MLAEYNPETGTTARKQTGSFYTPREIVNYMVDESLIAYLTPSVNPSSADDLRQLFAYTNKPHEFTPKDTEKLIEAIDSLKVLDPACGSGAFPMGVLHKLVFILGKNSIRATNIGKRSRSLKPMQLKMVLRVKRQVTRWNKPSSATKRITGASCI